MIESIKHKTNTIDDDVHLSFYENPERTEIPSSKGNSNRAGYRRMKTETSSTFQPSAYSETTSSSNDYESQQEFFFKELNRALRNRDYQLAIRIYDEIAALIPNDQEDNSLAIEIKDRFALLKACCYGLADHPKEALAICETINDNSRFNEQTQYYRGFFHLLDGDFEKGLAAFKAIDNPYDQGNMVLVLVLLEKRLGISLFDPEIEFETHEPNQVPNSEEGLKYLAQGRYREAIEHFDPRWDEDLVYAAFCHAMLGEWDEYASKIDQAMYFEKDRICFVNDVLSLLKGDLKKIETKFSRPSYTKVIFDCDPALLLAIRYFEKNR